MRTGSIIIFHLSKLWKAKFSILCDVIFLVRMQEKFDIDQGFNCHSVSRSIYLSSEGGRGRGRGRGKGGKGGKEGGGECSAGPQVSS